MLSAEVHPYLVVPSSQDATVAARPATSADVVRATDALRELRVEDAIEAYRRVLEVDPDNFYALAGIGIALTRVGITDQALTALHRASMMRPPSWEAFQTLSVWTRFAERQSEGNFRRSTATAPPRVVVRILEWLTRRTAAPDAGPLVPVHEAARPKGALHD